MRTDGYPQPELPGVWSATGWSPGGLGMDFETWAFTFGETDKELSEAEKTVSEKAWQIGDQINHGTMAYHEGDAWAQVLDESHYRPKTRDLIADTCRLIPWGLRRPHHELAFWHHYELRKLEPADMKQMIKDAVEQKLTQAEIRFRVQGILNPPVDDLQDEMFEGEGEADQGPDCPLCNGTGHVSEDRRRAYLMEEGLAR